MVCQKWDAINHTVWQWPQFVAEVAKAFMRASQLSQAHSTAHQSATNGLVERQNKSLLNMLSVFCSRRMNDWHDHLDEVMRAYNSSRHVSAGFSLHLLLAGQEKLTSHMLSVELKNLRTSVST